MLFDFFRITPKRRKIRYSRGKGVLFSNPTGWKRRLFYIGTGLWTFSVLYLVYLYQPIASAYYKYLFSPIVPQLVTKDTPLSYPTPVISQPIEYRIDIPKIFATSEVVADVPPFDTQAYQKVLENDVVAQAKGSDEPGGGPGTMVYIFAHSTSQSLTMMRKNAVFYLLEELKTGDVIFLTKDGKNYTYKVYDQKIVGASETQYLKYFDKEKEVLILQTCWPIGTNWKRLLVFAQRTNS